MKFSNSLLLALFTSGLALASPPENFRADRYKDLYLNSPITDAPPEKIIVKEATDLPDNAQHKDVTFPEHYAIGNHQPGHLVSRWSTILRHS